MGFGVSVCERVNVPAFMCMCACMHAKCACVISHFACAAAAGMHICERVCVRGAASVSDRRAEVMLRLG